jgi:hypothetical protein
MLTFPPEDKALKLVAALAKRSPLGIAWFSSIAELEIINRRLGISPVGVKLGPSTPLTDELAAAGLVEKYVDGDGGVERARLTDLGREVVRAYRSPGKMPAEITSANVTHFGRR